jgi:hypothetical protein
MRRTSFVLVGLVALLGLATTADAQRGRRGGGPAARQQEAEPQTQLPSAVSQAIASAFPGATVSDAEPDTDDGVSLYSVELSTGIVVDITADGVILEVGQDTTMQKIPAAAAQALQAAGAGAMLDGVQRVEVRAGISGGKVGKLAQPGTEYSATFKKGGKIGEVRVNADGKVLDPMEWEIDD